MSKVVVYLKAADEKMLSERGEEPPKWVRRVVASAVDFVRSEGAGGVVGSVPEAPGSGIPVVADESVPPGQAELRDGDRVVATVTGLDAENGRAGQEVGLTAPSEDVGGGPDAGSDGLVPVDDPPPSDVYAAEGGGGPTDSAVPGGAAPPPPLLSEPWSDSVEIPRLVSTGKEEFTRTDTAAGPLTEKILSDATEPPVLSFREQEKQRLKGLPRLDANCKNASLHWRVDYGSQCRWCGGWAK